MTEGNRPSNPLAVVSARQLHRIAEWIDGHHKDCAYSIDLRATADEIERLTAELVAVQKSADDLADYAGDLDNERDRLRAALEEIRERFVSASPTYLIADKALAGGADETSEPNPCGKSGSWGSCVLERGHDGPHAPRSADETSVRLTGIDFLFEWMSAPNPMLGGVSPLVMLDMGRGAKLAAFIRQARAAENGEGGL